MNEMLSTEWYQTVGVIVAIFVWVVSIAAGAMYMVCKFERYSDQDDVTKAARVSLATLLAAPVLGFCWIAILPLAVLVGIAFMVRDAVRSTR